MPEDAETQKSSKVPRERSPAFPIISLKTATERLEQFEATFQRHPAPFKHAGKAWGLKEASSQSGQIVAALKYYGFLDYSGSGNDRLIPISESGRTYLRAQQDSIKVEILRQAALKPTAFAKFWPMWGADRPIDEICLDDLVLKYGFNHNSAPAFLRVYDETIAFAGLGDSDKKVAVDDGGAKVEHDTDTDFKIGDLVNWLSGDQVQWNKPRKVIAIDEHDDGGRFYKVLAEGQPAEEAGWIPVEQAIAPEPNAPNMRGQPPFTPPTLDQQRDALPGMRKAMFPLDEGDVTLIFPEGISADGLGDLADYLEIFLKKERRNKKQPN